jgi:hypothetical protein
VNSRSFHSQVVSQVSSKVGFSFHVESGIVGVQSNVLLKHDEVQTLYISLSPVVMNKQLAFPTVMIQLANSVALLPNSISSHVLSKMRHSSLRY